MKQRRKQFKIQKEKRFCTMINIFSVLFPSVNGLFFLFDLHFIPIYDFLFIGFYSVLGNVLLFHQNKVVRTMLILINIVSLFFWYWVSFMGYWRGFLLSICYSVIPFFDIFLKIFR